jgi:uncharacterized metal-binding protein YceD (DUF177 family)
MPDHARQPGVYRVATLSAERPPSFDLAPGPEEMRAIAVELGLAGLRKLRFTGTLSPEGRADWRLDAHLGATVTQPCVVSLAPVTTRLEEDVTRRFLDHWPPAAEAGDEVEMPEDETIDPLGDIIDARAIMLESLTLALPPYPRAEAAEPATLHATPPGAEPTGNDEVRPFSALAELKRKLDTDDGG